MEGSHVHDSLLSVAPSFAFYSLCPIQLSSPVLAENLREKDRSRGYLSSKVYVCIWFRALWILYVLSSSQKHLEYYFLKNVF